MSQIMDTKDQGRLELTLGVREQIIKTMTKNGSLPGAPEDRDFLLKALDGMDRGVFSKAKLKIEDKNAQSQQDTARTISEVLKRVRTVGVARTIDTPLLDDAIIVEDKIPGEDAIGVSALTYDEFVSK